MAASTFHAGLDGDELQVSIEEAEIIPESDFEYSMEKSEYIINTGGLGEVEGENEGSEADGLASADTSRLRTGSVRPKHKCRFCPKRFVSPYHLRRHEVAHTGERPYACEACGATFGEKSYLRRHVRSHSEKKRFKCDQCPLETHRSDVLEVHKRTHSGEKPFQCPHCDFAFMDRSRLQRHLLSQHSNQPKRFPCPDCDVAFHQKDDLRRHKRSHTGEKPFACPHCDHRSARKSDLKRHIKRMHSTPAQ